MRTLNFCRADNEADSRADDYSVRSDSVVSLSPGSVSSVQPNTRHGHASRKGRTPEYKTWRGMIRRCEDPRDKSFARYGGRGIRVSKEWFSFERFLADMGAKPTSEHSIDRVDGARGYEPGNCRWATVTVQTRNRRNVHLVELAGEVMTIGEWARHFGVCAWSLRKRMRNGQSFAKALTALRGAPKRTSRK